MLNVYDLGYLLEETHIVGKVGGISIPDGLEWSIMNLETTPFFLLVSTRI